MPCRARAPRSQYTASYPDQTLIWDQRDPMIVLSEHEDSGSTHRPHRALNRVAPLPQLPGCMTDLEHLRVKRRDQAGGTGTRRPFPDRGQRPQVSLSRLGWALLTW